MSSLFLTRVRVYVCVRVGTRTQTHTLHVGYLVWVQDPGLGQDETPAGPRESRWTKSYIYLFAYVQSTHLYIYGEVGFETICLQIKRF